MNEQIVITDGYRYCRQIQGMISEYTQMLREKDSRFEQYLNQQGLQEEFADLQKKYARPEGRLYIAFVNGKPAGCVALKKIGEGKCEMKRLFVRPEFRGFQIGSQLVDLLLKEAAAAGYSSMYLDTMPFLENAVRLYQRRGFIETENYNASPIPDSLFFRKELL